MCPPREADLRVTRGPNPPTRVARTRRRLEARRWARETRCQPRRLSRCLRCRSRSAPADRPAPFRDGVLAKAAAENFRPCPSFTASLRQRCLVRYIAAPSGMQRVPRQTPAWETHLHGRSGSDASPKRGIRLPRPYKSALKTTELLDAPKRALYATAAEDVKLLELAPRRFPSLALCPGVHRRALPRTPPAGGCGRRHHGARRRHGALTTVRPTSTRKATMASG